MVCIRGCRRQLRGAGRCENSCLQDLSFYFMKLIIGTGSARKRNSGRIKDGSIPYRHPTLPVVIQA